MAESGLSVSGVVEGAPLPAGPFTVPDGVKRRRRGAGNRFDCCRRVRSFDRG